MLNSNSPDISVQPSTSSTTSPKSTRKMSFELYSSKMNLSSTPSTSSSSEEGADVICKMNNEQFSNSNEQQTKCLSSSNKYEQELDITSVTANHLSR